ncbi:MAG: S-adenosylmethionine:tRNA ribosyltransferase-isomerase [Mycobacteriales bacterium]
MTDVAAARLACEPALAFELGPDQVATTPPERRGIARDGVRMLVAGPDRLDHRIAHDLPEVLRPGDVLVLNVSQTMPASIDGRVGVGPRPERMRVHLSTAYPSAVSSPAVALTDARSEWVVEIRAPAGAASEASYADRTGTVVRLPAGGRVQISASHPGGARRSRLWRATVSTPVPLGRYLQIHGQPIRYGYVADRWPIEDYRTAHGDAVGSAEMPSAGRPLTHRLLGRLAGAGVQIERITLHTGVSSLESGEPPYAEWFSVPGRTAAELRRARRDGRRVIAVGTTVVRALESAVGTDGELHAAHGFTDLVVTPDRGVSTVDGMITGWHEPAATHLAMLQAVAGKDVLCDSYRAALQSGYRWHEFGDIHLLLP